MQIKLPEFALVLLVGSSGAGKSTFARRHFLPTEVISSDHCRAMVCDDENDQSVTDDAFEILHAIAAKRLKAGRLTVIDATNVKPESRKPLIALARQYHCPAVALVLDMPLRLCLDRNAARLDRDIADPIIRNHRGHLRGSLQGMEKEGFRIVHIFRSPEELENLHFTRQPNRTQKKFETGPFDFIGDVHGCFDELASLLDKLDYRVSLNREEYEVNHAEGRKLVFLGDLVDRGPKIAEVLNLVMNATKSGRAFCVAGNHDVKLARALQGGKVNIGQGLSNSLEQLQDHPEEFRFRVADFLSRRSSHYVFDGGRLVAAHAGLPEEMHGRCSNKVRNFCLYGQTTGYTDESGLPVRLVWANRYRGRAMVIHGHTPVTEPEWLNNTLCIDTGCVFGGKLTAFRYPERTLIAVPALAKYYQPPALTAAAD